MDDMLQMRDRRGQRKLKAAYSTPVGIKTNEEEKEEELEDTTHRISSMTDLANKIYASHEPNIA